MTIDNVPYIQTEEDNEKALARIAALWNSEIGTIAYAELEVLTVLVEAFEAKAYPIVPPSPQAAVRALMDRLSLAQKDLIPIFGSVSRVSEFLAGKRELSKEQAVRLHLAYKIPLEILLDVYKAAIEDVEKADAKPEVVVEHRSVSGHSGTGRILRAKDASISPSYRLLNAEPETTKFRKIHR